MLRLLLIYSLLHVSSIESKRPHILFILADDYGFHDIGYHGSRIQTPTLDELAADGVKLENYYVQPICTPTRSQLLTGRYQIRFGLQHWMIFSAQPNGLPLNETTLPQKLKEVGYATHMIGKWHLGFFKKEYLPTRRGFDSYSGYLTGGEDYFTHQERGAYPTAPFNSWSGYDFWRNEEVDYTAKGIYSTQLFADEAIKIVSKHNPQTPLFMYLAFQAVHGPLQVPARYIEKYKDIKDHSRRVYAGMVSAMDEAVGRVTSAFKKYDLWENTILVFSTDNGGQVLSGGNNWPLRGWKHSLWEGGVKGVGFVTSPLLNRPKRVSKDLMHVSDWFPTLVKVAGGSLEGGFPLDGYDMWDTISMGASSPRTEILHNIDPVNETMITRPKYYYCNHAAIRTGDWKLITGCPGVGEWIPPPESGLTPEKPGHLEERKSLWLFNIANDPEERHDLSQMFPQKVAELMKRMKMYESSAVPVRFPPPDPRANPELHGGVWSPWLD